MDIAVSPRRRPSPSVHTSQMLLPSGSGDLHTLTQFLYCWRQDNNVRQLHRKGTGNVSGPLKNLLYLCTRVNPMVLDHHNWWVEHPQYQRPRRESWNRKHIEPRWLDCIDDRPKPDLLWEEEQKEEVGHHLPFQNAREEQILMII